MSATVASLAYGVRLPAIEANAERVCSRLFAIPGDTGSADLRKTVAVCLEELLPRSRPGNLTAALMDLGQLVCRPGARSAASAPSGTTASPARADSPSAFRAVGAGRRRCACRWPQRSPGVTAGCCSSGAARAGSTGCGSSPPARRPRLRGPGGRWRVASQSSTSSSRDRLHRPGPPRRRRPENRDHGLPGTGPFGRAPPADLAPLRSFRASSIARHPTLTRKIAATALRGSDFGAKPAMRMEWDEPSGRRAGNRVRVQQ